MEQVKVDSVFVIYKDGKRLDKKEAGANVKVAYLKKGSANGVITTLVFSHCRYTLNLSEIYDHKKFTAAEKAERARYEVKEFVAKEG